MNEEFHLGHLIHDELNRQEHTIAWLARRIKCHRTTMYDLFERKYIDAERLELISIALKRNFFNDLAQYEGTVIGSAIQNH